MWTVGSWKILLQKRIYSNDCFIIDLYFLIPAVTTQIFNPTAKLDMPTGTPQSMDQKQKLKYKHCKQKQKPENVLSNSMLCTLFYPFQINILVLVKNSCFIYFFFKSKVKAYKFFTIFVFKIIIHYLAIRLITIREKMSC